MFSSRLAVLIAFLPAITLAFVLISPDAGDDVDAIAQLDQQIRSQVREVQRTLDVNPEARREASLTSTTMAVMNQLQPRIPIPIFRC
jgi:hypothetical protein